MKTTFTTLSLLALLLPFHAHAFKCWTNNEGVRECGNVVPPEYAQQKTRTINERGITTEVKERAKTKEELAEMKRPEMPALSAQERGKNFKEVELGFEEKMAIKEARRCLRCELEAEEVE